MERSCYFLFKSHLKARWRVLWNEMELFTSLKHLFKCLPTGNGQVPVGFINYMTFPTAAFLVLDRVCENEGH